MIMQNYSGGAPSSYRHSASLSRLLLQFSILSNTHVCNNQKLHMFNDLSLDYSVGQFFEDGRQATKDILSRGRVPIVTGGTGLYLRWYVLCSFLYNVKSKRV